MIVTVTVNPAIDKTLIVPAFKAGATNRATIERVEMGGKGINVARTLKRLGCAVVATGFLGINDRAGIAGLLARHGIESDFVAVPGETRVNLKVIDPVANVETEINEPGFAVPADAIAMLAARLHALAREASVIVLSGSLPPGAPIDLYAHLVAIGHDEDVPTLLDTAGAALAHGLASGPMLVKPNRAETEELLQTSIRSEDDLVAAADRLLDMGAQSVVISLGPEGALSASSEGVWRSSSPAVTARSTVGAGDAMMAALAYAVRESLPAPEALRLATAVGCAAAATPEKDPVADDIERLLPRIVVDPYQVARARAAPRTG